MNFKLVIILSVVLFTACNNGLDIKKIKNIDHHLDELHIKTVSDLYVMSKSTDDTLFIAIVSTTATNNYKFLDLMHYYIVAKLELYEEDFECVVMINQTLTNEKFYLKIFKNKDLDLINTLVFKNNSCLLRLTEILLDAADYENIWTLDLTVLNVNANTIGYNFNGAFLDLLYLFANDSDSGFASDVNYKRLQKIAVWLIFEKGVESEELKVINKILVTTGKSPVFNPMDVVP